MEQILETFPSTEQFNDQTTLVIIMIILIHMKIELQAFF